MLKSSRGSFKKEDIDIIHGHYLFPAGAAAVDVGKNVELKHMLQHMVLTCLKCIKTTIHEINY